MTCVPAAGHSLPLACSRESLNQTADQRYLAAVCDSQPIEGTACFRQKGGRAPICVPTFVGIGFEKSGSTKVYELLSKHPEIAVSKAKEANGWTMPPDGVTTDLQLYIEEQYSGALSRTRLPRAMGEFTPGYAQSWYCNGLLESSGEAARPNPEELTMARMHYLLPMTARFLVVMRDPVDRAWSHYQYHIHTKDCWDRGPKCLPAGSGFPVAVCHALQILGGGEFLNTNQERLLAKRLPAAWVPGEGAAYIERPWCPAVVSAQLAPGVQPRRFGHWDPLTPGLYYDNLIPWVSRFGLGRFAFIDMAWLSTSRATDEVFACLGLPHLDFRSEQLRAPSNTQASLAVGAHASNDPREHSPGAFELLDAFYGRSNYLTRELTGVGGDWAGGAANATAAATGARLAHLHYALCHRCVLNETTGMTHRC